jgi:hypothetical protein
VRTWATFEGLISMIIGGGLGVDGCRDARHGAARVGQA